MALTLPLCKQTWRPSMDDQQAEQEREAVEGAKLQQAMFIKRYQPTAGRADRSSTNIPGSPSTFGTLGAHTIGHGGSN